MANSLSYIACFTLAVFCLVHTAQALSIIPQPECGAVCAIACPCGNELDYRGCPICACKPCPPPIIPEPECGPVCAIACPCGNELDYRGCPICACKPCDLTPWI